MPILTDKGYAGAGIGVHCLITGRNLNPDAAGYNMLLTGMCVLGERANAELK